MATIANSFAIALQHHQAGRLTEAEQSLRQVVALEPRNSDAWHLLGLITAQSARSDEAIACFRRAVEIKPDYAIAYSNLGATLHGQGQADEALACFEQALRLKPDFADAHNNLGSALLDQDRLDEAVASFRRALELRPDFAKAHCNRGNALKQLRLFDEAFASFARAIELKPDYANAHVSRAMMRLLLGDFERGWNEYEWRWKTRLTTSRDFSQPPWDGCPLERKTILLHDEQGFGDTIQFARYARLVKEQNPAATVVFECQRSLVKLLARCPGVDRLISRGDEFPPFDVHAALLSLPRIVQTSLDTIPGQAAYLSADQSLVGQWRQRLAALDGLKIGINWHGRPGIGDVGKRNIPLEHFISLTEIPHVRLISLQKGEGRHESLTANPPIVDLGDDFDTAHGSFVDTAAVMMNLDLVISSDTAVPHLAGALGVPVWLAVPYSPDWRWLLDRTDSPWYATMRIFGQQRPGDWAGLFQEIDAALRELSNIKTKASCKA